MEEIESIQFELDFEKTYPYVKEYLEYGTALSKWVLENIDLREGKFFTYICESTDVSMLYYFKEAVIFPPPDKSEKFSLIQTLSYPLFEMISKKIMTHEVDFCALEEIMRTAGHPSFNRLDGFNVIKSIKEKFLYVMDCKNFSEDLFVKTIQLANIIWHCVGFAGQLREKGPQYGDEFPLENIDAEGDFLIIVGSYDSESYVIWEKNKN